MIIKDYKKALTSLSWLWIGSLLGSGSTFLTFILVAREIGPEAFGIFSSAIATINFFTLLAGFGVSQAWLKIYGKEGWGGVDWMSSSFKFVLYSLVLITIFLLFLANLPIQDENSSKIIQILVIYIYGFISVELVTSKLQLEESFKSLSVWKLFPNLLRLIITITCIYILQSKFNVVLLAWIYAFIGLISFFLALPHFRTLIYGKLQLKGHASFKSSETRKISVLQVFNESWPFGFANLFAFVYVQSDLIMVKYMSGNVEAGYYNVGYVILTATLVIPTMLFGKFLLPKYHRWSNHDTEKFKNVYRKSNQIMIGTGILIMILIVLSSRWVVPGLFGTEYVGSVKLVKILSLTIPISFLMYSVGATLVTNEHMKMKVFMMGVVALINVVLNLMLIPYYGAVGAAASTILSNILLLLLYLWGAKNRVFNNRFSSE
ncbi:flippase [Euzebyella marina]|uniref:Flippase n=1 Tax=Euzebyella marina TaxID=1761453 RepID=A0A3G2L1I9_9FLAO|nr:flippase [Euzebyella marina]AYN66091.1 flippase [Euzebyella marina]